MRKILMFLMLVVGVIVLSISCEQKPDSKWVSISGADAPDYLPYYPDSKGEEYILAQTVTVKLDVNNRGIAINNVTGEETPVYLKVDDETGMSRLVALTKKLQPQFGMSCRCFCCGCGYSTLDAPIQSCLDCNCTENHKLLHPSFYMCANGCGVCNYIELPD